MNFGLPPSAARAVGLVVLLMAVTSVRAEAPAEPASGWTVNELVARLKEQRRPAVAFEEKSYSSLLTEPLILRGVLRFTPPAIMEKEVRQPYAERYIVDGDRVLIDSARRGTKRTLSLDDYPGLRSLVEAFRASVTGDAARLEQIYETTIGGNRRQWTLLLRPREASGKALIDYILFSGRDGHIDTVAIRAPDGDRSVMTLEQGTAE